MLCFEMLFLFKNKKIILKDVSDLKYPKFLFLFCLICFLFFQFQNILFFSETTKKILKNVNFFKEKINPSKIELRKLREFAKNENFDEFFQEVYREINYKEVDFLADNILKKHSGMDEEIDEDFDEIILGLGDKGNHIDFKQFENEFQEDMNESIKEEGFNSQLSNLISPNRLLYDSRNSWCKSRNYTEELLPNLSVIISVHNEPLSVLTRTLYALFNRTSEYLLKEIIIIDDLSTYPELGKKLERYLITKFDLMKIRLIRLKKRAGLIRGRLLGAHFAIGDVLFFIDAHIEVGTKWAEPLLSAIKENRTSLVVPIIDEINHIDLGIWPVQHILVSGFNWNGTHKWISVPFSEKQSKNLPLNATKSPTIMGAAFAIDKSYFWEIGSFDPGMKIWGGENFELPFRIWQCGGSVYLIPCSRVGHLNRVKHTYDRELKEKRPSLFYNMARVAETWMDEYKIYFYNEYKHIKNREFGDISRRVELRKRLKCKSFDWFLKNVYKEKYFETLPLYN